MLIKKPIDGYEGLYEIYSDGRIFSYHRHRFLKPHVKYDGYLAIRLTKNKKVKNYYHHVLLAKHFIDNPENKEQVNHINGVKGDNVLENLEWCTRVENQQHAWRIGLCGDNIRNAVAESNRRRAKAYVN